MAPREGDPGGRDASAAALAARGGSSLLVMFVASGAAGLVYQLIWARWLGLVFGNTTTSVTVVLASFMAGLALGSHLAGRALRRRAFAAPILAYAGIEAAIAGYALLFPLVAHAIDAIFRAMVDTRTPGVLSLGVRTLLSFGALLVPTTLMGATLPLVTEHVRRAPGRAFSVGLLYAVNTLGAAAGALVSSFVLVELLGIRGTTLAASLLNLLAALLAYRLQSGASGAGGAAPAAAEAQRGWEGRAALVLLACSGAAALASEVLWTRALSIIVGKSTYVFAVILVVYLLGITAGSWLMSLVVQRLATPLLWLGATQALMGGWSIAALALRDDLSSSLLARGGDDLSALALVAECAVAAALLLPLAMLSGAAFPLGIRILAPGSGSASGAPVASAYSWNTAGAIAGALAGGFVVAPRTDLFHGIVVVAISYAATAALLALLALLGGAPKIPRRGAAALLVAAVVVAALGAGRLDEAHSFAARLARLSRGSRVAFYRTGLQGTTAVLVPSVPGVGSRYSRLLVNGSGMTIQVTATKMMAHLPLFAHPEPRRALVICFGMGTTFRSAHAHGVDVTAVELVREVPEAFGYFFPDAAELRASPRAHVVIDDGRNYLERSRERWDVITVDPPPPIDAAGVNHLYAREFYEHAREHLAPGGIMAQFIPLPNSRLAGVNDPETFRMLARTFGAVFPHVVAVPSRPSVGIHFLGSMTPIRIDPARVARLLEDPAVRADVVEWDSVTAEDFLGGIVQEHDDVGSVVSDDRPALEFDFWRSLRLGVRKDTSERW